MLDHLPGPGERLRCTACGNLTRFDVVTSRRTTGFWHFTVAGELTLGADASYLSTLIPRGTVDLTFPLTCTAASGLPLTCALLQLAIAAAQPGGGLPISSATCTGTTVCQCQLTLNPTPQTRQGTYTVDGGTLVLHEAATGNSDAVGYCALPPHDLQLRTTMSPATRLLSAIDATLVLGRQ